MKNNLNKPAEPFNVVYMYSCDQVPCNTAQYCYVGMTTTTIKERFKQHLSIKKHYRENHNINITGSQMIKNVQVLATLHNKQDLTLMEALYIHQKKPHLNIQANDFNRTLKIFN